MAGDATPCEGYTPQDYHFMKELEAAQSDVGPSLRVSRPIKIGKTSPKEWGDIFNAGYK